MLESQRVAVRENTTPFLLFFILGGESFWTSLSFQGKDDSTWVSLSRRCLNSLDWMKNPRMLKK